jgi:predicted nucleic acid-binding Zn ribbon protein
MSATTRSGKVEEWQQILTALEENEAELANLADARRRLEAMVNETLAVAQRQASLAAGKHEASQKLREVLAECQRQATVIRIALMNHYGPWSAKLAEFGIPPLRGRSPEAAPEPEAASTGE